MQPASFRGVPPLWKLPNSGLAPFETIQGVTFLRSLPFRDGRCGVRQATLPVLAAAVVPRGLPRRRGAPGGLDAPPKRAVSLLGAPLVCGSFPIRLRSRFPSNESQNGNLPPQTALKLDLSLFVGCSGKQKDTNRSRSLSWRPNL